MPAIADKVIVTVPHLFEPRDKQFSFLRAMDSGTDRAVLVWHRRYGKDTVCFNFMIKKAWERVGNYYYFFPTYKQGRMVIWDGRGKDGHKFLDHIPEQIIKGTPNKSEMKVELINGSIIQIIGLDKFDSKMGTNPMGCVFSEYSLQNPAAWDHIRPILRENKGWAVFNFTPRGRNHAHKLYKMAKGNPKWFCEVLTIKDTGLLTEEDIEEERLSGMSDNMILQEFFCDFTAANDGAYYGIQMREAHEKNRIGEVRFDPELPVDTWWDLGINDATAIWFTQTLRSPREIRVIDYYENTDEGLGHYFGILQQKILSEHYVYGSHYAPHDIKVRELTSGTSRKETAKKMGVDFKIAPNESVAEGIEAVRQIIPVCWFDEEKCKRGIDALESYHKKWNDIHKTFSNSPTDDWSSHAADAFRYMALSHKVNEIIRDRRNRVEAGMATTKYPESNPFARRRESARRAS